VVEIQTNGGKKSSNEGKPKCSVDKLPAMEDKSTTVVEIQIDRGGKWKIPSPNPRQISREIIESNGRNAHIIKETISSSVQIIFTNSTNIISH
jgi:hypothetical protein